jgi:drug/metabolite transporter (DMT)-like permease
MISDESRIERPVRHSDKGTAMRNSMRGLLFLIGAVFFWGGSASLGKLLIVTRFDTLIISQTRTSLAFVIFLVYFLIRDPKVFIVRPADIWKLALLGIVGVAITNYTYYFTIKESTVATAILIQYTAPVWIVLYSVFLSRAERMDRITAISLFLALAGCDLAVTGGSWRNVSLNGLAVMTGLISAFTYAFQIVGTKQLLKRYSVWTVLVYIFGASAVFWMFINPPSRILSRGYGPGDWGLFWIFSIISILIPQTLFAMGLKLLDTVTVGIVGILEPVFAIVIAFAVLGESLDIVQTAGAILVIFAVALLQIHPLTGGIKRKWNENRTKVESS